jgi:hypothetical protein
MAAETRFLREATLAVRPRATAIARARLEDFILTDLLGLVDFPCPRNVISPETFPADNSCLV